MAEVGGGPLAHQLPLHNHRGGLVQPSLVMNHHHMDLECGGGHEIHATNISEYFLTRRSKDQIAIDFIYNMLLIRP